MRLLDLFCGAGGCSVGYHRAGFDDITGVDIRPMPRYPFKFIQGDALEYLGAHGHEYDVIHASPPCQRYSSSQRIQGNEHPDLIDPVRQLLIATGKPYVIENVPDAPLRKDMILCGSMFGLYWNGLTLYRHRWFEFGGVSMPASGPATCCHNQPAISIFGHCVLGAAKNGHSYKHPNERVHLGTDIGRLVMGVPWMNRAELTEAIPPAYTEYIGAHLLEAICERRRA